MYSLHKKLICSFTSTAIDLSNLASDPAKGPGVSEDWKKKSRKEQLHGTKCKELN